MHGLDKVKQHHKTIVNSARDWATSLTATGTAVIPMEINVTRIVLTYVVINRSIN